MNTAASLPDMASMTILYVRTRVYDSDSHPLSNRAQFTIEIGYGGADADYARGHKELSRHFSDRASFETGLEEALALGDLQLKSEESFDERVFGPTGLVPDSVTTRRYSTAFYDRMLVEIAD